MDEYAYDGTHWVNLTTGETITPPQPAGGLGTAALGTSPLGA